MKEMIKNIGNAIIVRMRVCNISMGEWYKSERRFTESRPLNKFDWELSGMLQALKHMGIEYEVNYNDSTTQYTGIEIMGIKFEV